MKPPIPLPPAGCWSAYASPNVTEGTFFAEQMADYGEACAAAAVAAEKERVRRALMDMQAACKTHNYYHCAAVAIFGPDKKPSDAQQQGTDIWAGLY